MIASVALAIPYSSPFDYLIPTELNAAVRPGSRVLVPLHRRGMVAIKEESECERLRAIEAVVDASPVYDSRLLEITRWISEYYLCAWGEVLEAAIPTGLKPRIEKVYSIRSEHTEFQRVAQSERKWLLQLHGLSESGVEKLDGYKENASVMQRAIAAGSVSLQYRAVLKNDNAHLVEVFSLASDYKSRINIRKGSKSYNLIAYLKKKPRRSKSQIATALPGSAPAIRNLAKKNILCRERIAPIQTESPHTAPQEDFFALNDQQKAADREINSAVIAGEFEVFLLFGVTGSGKTEVYLHAVRETLQQNRTALILLPEISLTPQAVSRFKRRFGEKIAVLHSGMSERARCEEWWKIKSGLCSIVIGARSAIFAPLQNIGLIVVDEEHDTSYKQQETPFYHARDTAVKIGSMEGAVVVLGSATPSVESYFNCQSNKYRLLALSQRVNRKPLPSVGIIDLRKTRRQPGIFYLSDDLVDRLRENYLKGRQALIFLNRRGFASVVACTSCSAAVLCRNCSIAMTWHRKNQRLICHHCGFFSGYPTWCAYCGGRRFRLEGLGTQRVERDIQVLFPKARFLRMDRDAIAKRGALEKFVQLIADHKVDFVVGTQLISKGHDFQNIGLVCVVLADMSLNIPDFRSSERSFQLFSQVAGRAGRDPGGKGQALVQSYNPSHYAVVSANENDYLSFYRQEIKMREDLSNPPYTRLLLIRLSEPNPRNVEISARILGERLRNESTGMRFQMMGPIESPTHKVNNRYYWQILIKSSRMGLVKQLLLRTLWEKKEWKPKGRTRVSVDVDPFAMI